MRRRILPGLIVLGVLGVVVGLHFIRNPKPDSYAYVTAAERDCNGNEHCYCDAQALLPRTRLDHRPSGPHPDLLRDAAVIHDHENADGSVCDEVLHTWVDAFEDDGGPAHAYIVLPRPGWFSFDTLLSFAIVGVLAWIVWAGRKRKKAAREDGRDGR